MWNDFYSPIVQVMTNGVLEYDIDEEFEFHMQTRSKPYPEYPIRSREAYNQRRKTLGHQSTSLYTFSMYGPEFHEDKFCRRKENI